MFIPMRIPASAAVVALLAPAAHATMFDLTHAGSSVTIAGAIYETADFRPAGTGFIRSFVRIQSKGTEQGYNTSARPVAFDENTDQNFTRDVQLKDLGLRTINGVSYVQFSLDINESNNSNGRYLSLDRVQIYVSATGNHTGANLALLGTKVYDIDTGADNWVKLDYRLNSGSGQGDMKMFVPLALFAGFDMSSFVTLYSKFGTNDSSNAGFEEWVSMGAAIPSPGASALAVCGLALLRRRR